MANFRRPRHSWDIDSPQYRGRKLAQRKSKYESKVMYSSGYIETGKMLRNSRKLERIMYMNSRRLLGNIRSAVGRDEGTGGYHLQDVMKMRLHRKGGMYRDRMAFHLTVDANTPAGQAFINAEERSKYSREAWKARTGAYGEPANRSIKRNRRGWIRRGLMRSGRPEGMRGE